MLRQVRERAQHRRAIAHGFAHADDAAAADIEARVAHRGERVEPILVGARGDDLAVELRRGVDVVVVVVEAGVLELVRLLGREHAERRAGLHAERAHFANHRRDGFDVCFFFGERHAAPMQKRVAPASFARLRARARTSSSGTSFSRSRPVS